MGISLELGRLVLVSAAVRAEPGWLPLAAWHDLSDFRLTAALDDRAGFRRFCGFAAHEATPERTAFVRFQRELVRRGLDRLLFKAVTGQFEGKGVAVRTGTLSTTVEKPAGSR